MMSELDQETKILLDWLDTPSADQGLTLNARTRLSPILEDDEDSYQRFANVILSPIPGVDPQVHLPRSYRALNVLLQDLQRVTQGAHRQQGGLVNAAQAGLLTKQVLNALDKDDETTVLIHKRTLLDALLDAYPAAVVSAACAGGKEGMEAHLKPMMAAKTCHQTLPSLTSLILYGCTGKKCRSSSERTAAMVQQTAAQAGGGRPLIAHGHRRKFVKGLCDWEFLTRLVQCIVEDAKTETSIGLGEEACEALLTIVECIGYPDPGTTAAGDSKEASKSESLGEEMLLSPLGVDEWWDPLMKIVSDRGCTNEASRVAATRAVVGIFGLATGHSNRIMASRAPIADETESMEGVNAKEVEKQQAQNTAKDNKLRQWGLTAKIHKCLVSHISQILRALTVQEVESDSPATVYLQRGGDDESVPLTALSHPGRCRIVPFSSWRLQVVTLLAELVSFVNDDPVSAEPSINSAGKVESPRSAAMSALMELSLPPSIRKPGDETPADDDDESALNPWPALCDWVFQYPENTLYHVQFLRMFQAICLEHHESTLRLVLQKVKFVSRAIRACASTGSLRGMLLVCLNTLRLRSETLPPSAFLRQFLESHDAWKGFHATLRQLTASQRLPLRHADNAVADSCDINLGSEYARELGFDCFVAFKDDVSSGATAAAKKRKKGKKNKKKKSTQGTSATGPGEDNA